MTTTGDAGPGAVRTVTIAAEDCMPAGAAYLTKGPVVDMAIELARLRAQLREAEGDLAAARAEVGARDRQIAVLEAEAKAVDDALAKQTFDEWEGLDRQQMAAVIATDMRHIMASVRRRAARTRGGSDAG